MIDLARLAAAPAADAPFPYVVAEGLVAPDALAQVGADFPAVGRSGLFPLSAVAGGPAFARLAEDLRQPMFAALIGGKLGLDLSGLPMMITVRGVCGPRDGRTHVDSRDKAATGILYLNDAAWDAEGGRLRLLRSADLDDVIAEVPPTGGTLIAFRRTENSWHGHRPFEGPRRYLMFNWLRSEAALAKNVGRHRISAAFKRLVARHAG